MGKVHTYLVIFQGGRPSVEFQSFTLTMRLYVVETMKNHNSRNVQKSVFHLADLCAEFRNQTEGFP